MRRETLLLVAAVSLTACAGDPPGGLAATVRAGGPAVIFDLLAEPLPEVPLPNDTATRLDPTSPTGRRINVSGEAVTRIESKLRRKAEVLDGFGTLQPITVSFAAPLDLVELRKRQRDNDDIADDAVYVVDVTPGTKGFGKVALLDFGSMRYPYVLRTESKDNYWQHDPRRWEPNLMFETVEEDLNCNGALDPGEDTDGDGVLDHPNTWDGRDPRPEDLNDNGEADPGERDLNCNGKIDPLSDAQRKTFMGGKPDEGRLDALVMDNVVSFWERETNTLIVRPIVPLVPRHTYAVVLTKRLVGANGKAVESPFPYVHHAAQLDALGPLAAALSVEAKIGIADVAFAWTYTTGSQAEELDEIRRGLYGGGTCDDGVACAEAMPCKKGACHGGPFAWLAQLASLEAVVPDRVFDDAKRPFAAPGDNVGFAISAIDAATGLGDPADAARRDTDQKSIDYWVSGHFLAPNFLVDKQGLATDCTATTDANCVAYPADEDESFEMDLASGTATVGLTRVDFWCAIPKTTAQFKPPFPVVVYGHGYGSNSLEGTNWAGRMSRFGLSVCALSAYGHGLPVKRVFKELKPDEVNLFQEVIGSMGITGFVQALADNRARDLDNDGKEDPGGDFWTSDVFHTRDMVRQSVLEHIQFYRMLRTGFDGKREWLDTDGDGIANLAGDWNGDGTVDIGGLVGGDGKPQRYAVWGESLGGILSAIVAGAEPAIDAAAPTAGAAGLLDVAIRSKQGGVPDAVFLPMLGPFVIGAPQQQDGVDTSGTTLTFLVTGVADKVYLPFAVTTDLAPGDRVEVTNLANGVARSVDVPLSRRFRLAFPADAADASERRALVGMKPDNSNVPVAANVLDDARLAALGDRVRVRVMAPGGSIKTTIDRFAIEASFLGVKYPVGMPLVAPGGGLGYFRQSPSLRRFVGIAGMILGPGDPAVYATRYMTDADPARYAYDPETAIGTLCPGANVIDVASVGDMNVPVNAGIAIARAAGLWHPTQRHARLGDRSVDAFLAETFALEGVAGLRRFDERKILYDVDNLDEGFADVMPIKPPKDANPWNAPQPPVGKELRWTVPSSVSCPARYAKLGTMSGLDLTKGGRMGLRMPYMQPEGQHGFSEHNPSKIFDARVQMGNLVSLYFWSAGAILPGHDESSLCYADDSCAFFPWPKEDIKKPRYTK